MKITNGKFYLLATVLIFMSNALLISGQLPDSTLQVSDSEICPADTGEIVVSLSEADVSYQLFIESTDDSVSSSKTGTGGDLAFKVAPLSSSIYYLKATREDTLTVILKNKPTVFVDTTNPIALCHSSLNIYLDDTGEASISADKINNESSDNCNVTFRTLSQYTFNCNHLGINHIILTIEDATGNQATCTSEVHVLDTHKIIINTKDISRSLSDPNSEITISGLDLTESIQNNCPIDTVILSQATFDCNHIGINEVWMYVTDIHGKTDSASAIVTLSYATTPSWADQYHDTLCSGHTNTFWLQANIGSVSYNWEPVGSYPGLNGDLNGSLVNSGEGSQTLSNDTTHGILFEYNIQGHAPNGCKVLDTNLLVLVDPVPEVITDRAIDTICNNSEISFTITPETTSTLKTYLLINTIASVNVTGHTGHASVSAPFTISQTLQNSSNNPEKVVYAITPHYHNTDVEDVCTGPTIYFDVWVEPTITVTPDLLADTLCNLSPFTLSYSEVSSHKSGKAFLEISGTAENPDSFAFISPSQNIFIDSVFTDSLYNISPRSQKIQYTATPFIELSHSTCYGTPVNTELHIEPDPALLFPILNDTICNNAPTSLIARTEISPTIGIHYNVEAIPDNPAHLSGYSDVSDYRTTDTIFQVLSNHTAQSQKIRYAYKSYLIGQDGSPTCYSAISDTIRVWVEPSIQPVISPLTDTICSEGTTGLEISTSTALTQEALFRYSILPDNGLSVIQSDTSELASNTIITDMISNHSDSVKKVKYLITGYCQASNNENIYDGYTDTATIWIDPEVKVTPLLSFDTLCNEDQIRLFVQTSSNYSNEFRYDVTVNNTDPTIISGHEQVSSLGLSDTTSQQLINHRDTPQNLQYIITSYSILSNGSVCEGETDSISVTVDPYPEIDAIVSRDTLCHKESLLLSLTELSQTTGTLMYDLSVDTVSTDTSLLSGYYAENALNELSSSTQFLHNKSENIQWIQYRYHPYIEPVSGAGNCSYGTQFDKIVHIEVTAALQSDITPSVYNGGWNITCHNAFTGSSEAFVNGGAYGYPHFDDGNTEFVWSDGQSGNIIHGLQAGTYTVSITDFFGCTVSDTIILAQPSALTANTSITEIDCSGGSDGQIELHPGGGTPEYFYVWNGPSGFYAERKDIDNLIKGSYSVTITDENNCSFQLSGIAVNAPDPIQWGPTTSDYNGFAISCHGDNDGYITPDIYGSGPSYLFDYQWTGPDGFEAYEEDIYSLKAGLYSLSVTDTANCSNILEISLNEPDSLKITIQSHNISCVDDSAGSALAEASGGSGGYNYLWCDNTSNAKNTQLTIGTYFVTVTDNNNCSISDSALIGKPLPIDLKINVVSDFNGYDVSCKDSASGSVFVDLTDASDSVDFIWNDTLMHHPLRENMKAGVYELLVRDDRGCTASGSVSLNEPEKLKIKAEGISTYCYETNDGMVWASASGGVPGYTYHWDGYGHSEDSAIYNLSRGFYAVTVYDKNLCAKDTIVEVPCPEPITIELETAKSSCAQKPNGKLSLRAKGGTAPYALEVDYYTHIFDSTLYIDDLLAKKYKLTLIDSMECSYPLSFSIHTKKDHCLKIFNAFSPNNDGYNDHWIFKDLEHYPPAHLEVFDRHGRLVYFSNAYANDWNGRSKGGKPLPDGSYFYFLHVEGFDNPVTGTITLIR